MVQGKWYPMGSNIDVPISIRQAVFGRGQDERDSQSWQVTVLEGEKCVGTGRLWWQNGIFRIGDIGVLQDERGKGFGDLLIRLLLFKCLNHNAGVIALEAPDETASFFEKYGFKRQYSSNSMTILSLRGEDVQLSHCGGNCAECSHHSEECVPKALR